MYVPLAIALYVVAAYLHVGYVHADEYYQVFQFAAVKVGLHVLSMPWEYSAAMRSTLLPVVIVVIYKFYALFTSPDPFVMGFIMRIIASIISLSSIIIMLRVFLPTINGELSKKYLCLLALFTLTGVYFNIHYCSENISGSFILIGFSLLFANFKSPVLKYILIGLCFAIAFTARFQIGFFIFGILAWLVIIKRLELKLFIILLSSLIISIVLFNIVLDYWYYGHWTITAWNYFKQNILLNKVNGYKSEPWFYFVYMGASIVPFGLLYVISSILLFAYKPRHPLTWALLPFIVVHSLISHKEIRFMVPIINFMPLCLMYAVEIVRDKFGIKLLAWQKTIKTLWWINCLSLVAMAIPPTTEMPLYKYLYKNYRLPIDYYFLTYGGSDVDFYKRQDLISHKIDKVEDIKCDSTRPCLLALTCGQVQTLNFHNDKQIVYSQCPSFLYKINFGDWVGRTAIYNIYRLN
jgi:phosphatidylinositol glycan class B